MDVGDPALVELRDEACIVHELIRLGEPRAATHIGDEGCGIDKPDSRHGEPGQGLLWMAEAAPVPLP